MAATAYRYLVNLPGICQGRTIVEATRIGVHDVVGLIVNGASVDDVLRSFPDLTRAQVYECLAFYEDHRTMIDALVAEQMAGLGARSSCSTTMCRAKWRTCCDIGAMMRCRYVTFCRSPRRTKESSAMPRGKGESSSVAIGRIFRRWPSKRTRRSSRFPDWSC